MADVVAESGVARSESWRRQDVTPPRSGGAGAALWRAANLWQRRQKTVLAEHGLTPAQYLLLDGLAALDAARPVTQAMVARHCGADAMMTSQLVRELERKALVLRAAHPGDSRAVALALTAEGRARLERAGPAVAVAEAAFFGVLGADAPAFAAALRLLTGERPRRRVAAGHAAAGRSGRG